jgi:hypothetical protein
VNAIAADDARLRLFAPAWRGIGDQDPAAVARKFSIIYTFNDAGPFHEGNSASRIIIYSLGPYVSKAELKTIAPEALAHDPAGEVVKARDWPNWLVVPDNPKLLEHEQKLVNRLMAGSFDGLFIDSLGTAPIDSTYVLTKALNPNTAQPYTKEQWLAAEIKMVNAARQALPPGKLLFMNGLGPGTRYWTEPEAASPRILLAGFDGAMSESIWRMAKAPLSDWPAPDKWMLDIRMIKDVDRRGLYSFWWTKCGSVVGETPTDEAIHQDLIPQWRRFALASYLLAAGPKSYFNFLAGDKKLNNGAQYYPEYDAPLGSAAGPMQPLGDSGVYWRPFQQGLVIVNPTAQAVGNLRPDRANQAEFTVAGENRLVRAPFTIPAHTGWILTK